MSKNIRCSSCGHEIGQKDRFCGICGAGLSDEFSEIKNEKPILDRNKKWERYENDFARRIDVQDVKGILSKNIVVEEGTKALMIQGGVYKGFLPPGVYNVGNILSSVAAFRLDRQTTVILADASEVRLGFTIPKNILRTKDSVPVGVSGRYTIQIKDPRAFLENCLKGRQSISTIDLENRLLDEIQEILKYFLAGCDADELFGNRELHRTLERDLKNGLNAHADAIGLEILRLNDVSFDDADRRIIHDRRRDFSFRLEMEEDENAYQKAHRELETDNAADEFRQEMMRRKAETETRRSEIEARHGTEGLDEDLRRERAAKASEFERSESDKRFEQMRGRKRKWHEDKMVKWNDWREIQRQRELDRLEAERIRLENRSSASAEALILTADPSNPNVSELAEMERMKRAAALTPEQIMALNTRGDQKAAGEALSSMRQVDQIERLQEQRILDQQRFLKTMQVQNDIHLENMAKNMNSALDAMGRTAAARSAAQNPNATVIAGGKRTVVIGAGAQTDGSFEKDGTAGDQVCPFCSKGMPEENLYCPSCGKKVR